MLGRARLLAGAREDTSRRRLSKAQARQFLWQCLRKPARDLVPGPDGGEGLSDEMLATFPDGTRSEILLSKFQTPESLELLIVGGTAGRFTAIVPGSPFRDAPSRLVFRKIGSSRCPSGPAA